MAMKVPEKVIEIGTVYGYQTAVLAELAKDIYTVELSPSLTERAKAALAAEGYTGIKFKTGDGAAGWPEYAPYDAIILTCAAPEVPKALFDQLGGTGRLIAPVGEAEQPQKLMLYTKEGGVIKGRSIAEVRFVPMRK
jgi:protein-L-isoaspartate(D-aspartate) O-methyltransferase